MKRTAKRVKQTPAGTPATSDSQRRAAVILEVLAGIRTAQEAADVLKISVNHYYILERKALAGLVTACEPAARRGPQPNVELQVKKLEQELTRCRQECQRQAALVRVMQRAVGVPVTASDAKGSKRPRNGKPVKRCRRRQPRAVRAAKSLQKKIAAEDTSAVQPSGDQGGETSPTAGKETLDGSTRT